MFKKIAVVAMAAVMVMTVQATYACDSAKQASATETKSCSSKDVKQASAKSCASKDAQQASAKSCASKTAMQHASAKSCSKAEAKSCTKAQAAACGAKKGFTNASAQYLCTKSRSEFAKMAPFSFLNEAKCDEVHVGVESTEDGFALVFTGVNEANVEKAMQLANQSMEALAKPAACEYTRASMAKAAGECKSTKACLTALADCNVAVVEIEGGAKTVITTAKADKVKELHGVLATAGVAPEAASSDSE